MYAYLEGDLTYKSPSLLYVAAGGLGYEVHITLQTYDKIQHLDHCRLFTHLQIREDAWVLYGFADEAERATFRQLLAINGIGAGTARILLSSLTPAELEKVVASGDAKALERVKGIGAKTAQRIILELKGKLHATGTTSGTTSQGFIHNTKEDDALIALINLGISRAAAEAALKKAGIAENQTVEDIIKAALRAL